MTRFLWFVFWPILWIYLKVFSGFQIKGEENLQDLKKPFIIAANHASYLDGGVISAALPWNSDFFPIRFMIKKILIDKPVLGSFLKILGVYSIQRDLGLENSLAETLSFLKNGECVAIFPEGKRAKEEKINEAKPGIAYLAFKTGVQILPIAICGTHNLSLKRFFLGQNKIKAVFGKPFYLSNLIGEPIDNEDINFFYYRAGQLVMEKIKELLKNEGETDEQGNYISS